MAQRRIPFLKITLWLTEQVDTLHTSVEKKLMQTKVYLLRFIVHKIRT